MYPYVYDNIIKIDFKKPTEIQVFVTDIAYQSKLFFPIYLFIIQDLYNNKITARRIDKQNIAKTLQ